MDDEQDLVGVIRSLVLRRERLGARSPQLLELLLILADLAAARDRDELTWEPSACWAASPSFGTMKMMSPSSVTSWTVMGRDTMAPRSSVVVIIAKRDFSMSSRTVFRCSACSACSAWLWWSGDCCCVVMRPILTTFAPGPSLLGPYA